MLFFVDDGIRRESASMMFNHAIIEYFAKF